MSQSPVSRYNNIAISFHWLIAILIIDMLVVGKYMVSLEESDPLRFTLTQWHKTFGILILLLSVLRLLWRLTHKAPSHPEHAPKWEHFAANATHIAMYALLFIAPLTGWMLVSVSPLNIDTLLFNVVPWPHLPWLHELTDKENAVHFYADLHVWATGAIILLLLLHVGAALKHHFFNKDTVLTRMLPSRTAGTGKTMAKLFSVLALAIGGSVFAYSKLAANSSVSLNAGNSAVSALATVMGDVTPINFSESFVDAQINSDNLATSSLKASVPTATVTSSNLQVQGSLPDAEWFDSANFPEASFESTSITAQGPGQYLVEGLLTIKDISQAHTFTLLVEESETGKKASGEFTVDRSSYKLGMVSQSSPDYVKYEVTIAFEFELLAPQ